nr:immunoglobulin heavy chain junction region [Macaca mulatta]MOV38030.1 immunoglobulin heavy chain junction region [Macaca mulatta]MOV38377.1 immunoglobulin heavy chain junction region [Macaca mulatta]MOV38469.1 immunoglobulin heavy chain junction region [Macaca mulatta]MOV38477.1 immunoglobulin heavy chain junction region [Macaca mulatta]
CAVDHYGSGLDVW